MVACLLPFCSSPCSTAGEARAAAKTWWQTTGATLPSADARHGRRQNPSTMDGARSALVPLTKGFGLSAHEARCVWRVLSRGRQRRRQQNHSVGASPRESVASLDSSKKTKFQPKVGLERADRFIHHVEWLYQWVCRGLGDLSTMPRVAACREKSRS